MPLSTPPSPPAPSARNRSRPGVPAVGAGLVLALGLVGCSQGADAPVDGAPAVTPAAAAPAVDADAFAPFSLDNCGVEIEVDAPPQKVVTIKSSTFELMLALGLEDRVVGTAFLDGAPPERYADAAEDVPVIAEGAAPGREAVLTLEPDMVFAGWESNFSADGAGERADLDSLGVLTYVAPAACKAPGYMPDPLTFETVFDGIVEAGEIFGVPDAAADLVAEQRETLEAVVPDDRGLTALWYSSGTDVPYVGAGIGAPQMIMDAAGLTNVAGDVQDTWTPFGWEEIAAADPDVIVLVDATWNSAQQKIELLESNPTASQLTAVRESRYVIVPFAATEAGVRNVDAATEVADALAQLEVAP